MRAGVGWVREIRLDFQGRPAAWISCDSSLLPEPGQYMLAWNPHDSEAALTANLFPGEISRNGFLALDFPGYIEPGIALELRGPLGRGFRLPNSMKRLALAAFANGSHYLLPLVERTLERQVSIALYCDPPIPPLPTSIEVSPLALLSESFGWADFLVVDLTPEHLPDLAAHLSEQGASSKQMGQVLLRTAMPCSGLAECGVCAVGLRRGWKYACKDGPVFDLRVLEL